MFWLTARTTPAAAHRSTHSRACAHRHRQRLLRQNASDMVVVPDRLADQSRLRVRRHGDVEHLNVGVGQQVGVGGVDARDVVHFGGGASVVGVARGDGDGVEAGLAVGDEMTVAHDEAGAGAADAEVLAARQPRQMVRRRFHDALNPARWRTPHAARAAEGS